MDAALKTFVVPWLRSQGFKGSLPHFRRHRETVTDLLSFQFDKYGGGFVIEIAQCSREGVAMCWGKTVPATKATALHVDGTQRLRLCTQPGPSRWGWLRYDRNPLEKVTAQVLEELGQSDLWDRLAPSFLDKSSR